MIRRIKQRQRQVEQVAYIHMRYKPPPPSPSLFPLICYPRTSSKQIPWISSDFCRQRRDEWDRVGAEIFFRDLIAHYFIQNALMFPSQPTSIIVFGTNQIYRDLNFIKQYLHQSRHSSDLEESKADTGCA
jgi:hypothetical protein